MIASRVSRRQRRRRPSRAHAVLVSGERVGQAVVLFTNSGLASADHVLQRDLLQAIFGAAGLAAVLALLTGLAMARRITRPVERIIAGTRAMGRGERTARVGDVAAPGELRELATAFDQMADTLDRQEQLRRDLIADLAHELRTLGRGPAGRATRRCSTGSPSRPRTSWRRCGTRCCGWPAWSVTCRPWPPPTPPRCS